MKLKSLCLIVTDDCNFHCDYCYKKKKKVYMTYSTAEKTLLFFCLS
jgi:molybdenum cofactor biosynthesis enzyme MoaA